MNGATKTTKTIQTQLPSATMSLCLLFKPVASTQHHNSFVDKCYLLQMSMLPHLLFFYFSSVRILFLLSPWPCYSAPSQTERSSFCQRLSPVLSLALSLFIALSLTPPPRVSLLELTIEVQGETHMFASGRGVKRGAGNKEQVWRRDSLHLNACLLVLF